MTIPHASSHAGHIRPPAVAGLFYPDEATALQTMVRQYLSEGVDPHQRSALPPKALIVPHAGYIYSGAVAGAGFARLLPWADQITRVILFGPAHRVSVRGLAIPDVDAFATPLGTVALDRDALDQVTRLPQVRHSDLAHAPEHSLEVQLPFLQSLLGTFTLAPFVVGDASPEDVVEIMNALWGGDETVIVISTDLTHFLDYTTARRVDAMTCRAVEQLDVNSIGYDQACGNVALRAMLIAARQHLLQVSTVALCNSGDTAGDKSRVVGYGSWVFTHAET